MLLNGREPKSRYPAAQLGDICWGSVSWASGSAGKLYLHITISGLCNALMCDKTQRNSESRAEVCFSTHPFVLLSMQADVPEYEGRSQSWTSLLRRISDASAVREEVAIRGRMLL